MTKEQFLKNLLPPEGNVDVVLDTDTYNEVDDQFAIAYMLNSPELNPVAIYAAPFFNDKSTGPEDGMEKSYDEIFHILKLAGRTDMNDKVYKGAREYLKDKNTGCIPGGRASLQNSNELFARKSALCGWNCRYNKYCVGIAYETGN